MPFDYYYQLNKRQQRDYRKSDEVEGLTFPKEARERLRDLVDSLEAAIDSGKLGLVQEATAAFCSGVTRAFKAGPVRVQVKSRRPVGRSGEEYYGLTTWVEGKTPLIEMWMRTRAQQRVVAFKTYLRTLIHELLHHLDRSILGLRDTFHTKGFFKRESSMFRQLARKRPARGTKKASEDKGSKGKKPGRSAGKNKTPSTPKKTKPMRGKKSGTPEGSGQPPKKGESEQLLFPF